MLKQNDKQNNLRTRKRLQLKCLIHIDTNRGSKGKSAKMRSWTKQHFDLTRVATKLNEKIVNTRNLFKGNWTIIYRTQSELTENGHQMCSTTRFLKRYERDNDIREESSWTVAEDFN